MQHSQAVYEMFMLVLSLGHAQLLAHGQTDQKCPLSSDSNLHPEWLPHPMPGSQLPQGKYYQ